MSAVYRLSGAQCLFTSILKAFFFGKLVGRSNSLCPASSPPLPSMRRIWRLVTGLGILGHAALAAGNNSTIAEAFPQLENLTRSIASPYSLSIGSQDMDHCCLLAVSDSLNVVDGTIKGFTPNQKHIKGDLSSFRQKQFPCGAKYIGDRNGAPDVTITYTYCRANCPGWQRSKSSKLNQWVAPFVGFIIPSVVFCLGIPRRYVDLLFET